MSEPKRESNALIWWIAGGVVVLMMLLSNARVHRAGEDSGGNANENLETIIATPSYVPPTEDEPPPSARLTERERELYRDDTASRGFTDSDREFLREHGVSEDEARAAETVLREHGVE